MPLDAPSGYFRMEALAGGSVDDELAGAALAVTLATIEAAGGIIGNGLRFATGNPPPNDTATTPIAGRCDNPAGFSVSLWFKTRAHSAPPAPLPLGRVLTIAASGGGATFRVETGTGDFVNTFVTCMGTNVAGPTGTTVADETLHHLFITVLPAVEVWVQLNGGAKKTVLSGSTVTTGAAAGVITLGRQSGTGPSRFTIDELAIFNAPQTEAAGLEAYAAGLAGLSLLLEDDDMTSISSLAFLRYGKHTSNTQVESDSGVSYVFAEYDGDIAARYRNRKLERNLRRGDGERYSRVVGPRDVPTLGFSTLLRGLNANSGGAVTTAKQTEVAPLLDVIMGANGTGGTGSVAAASGHSTTTLVVDDASAIPIGAGVLFESTTEGWLCREVVSKSSNTLTLDRAYAGDPINDGVVYAACSWYPDNDAPNHVHLAADVEWLGVERTKMLGGMGSLVVDFPANGGLAMCAWSFDFSDDDPTAAASPSFVAPTVGSPIPCIDGTFWLGADELLLRDAKLSVTPAKTPKQHYAAANGAAGFVVTDIEVVLEGTLLMGALTGEATASTRATLQGATAQDIAFQLGRAPGASVYLRMPAADFDADKGSVDGQDVLQFRAVGTRSGNHANVPGAARIHLF